MSFTELQTQVVMLNNQIADGATLIDELKRQIEELNAKLEKASKDNAQIITKRTEMNEEIELRKEELTKKFNSDVIQLLEDVKIMVEMGISLPEDLPEFISTIDTKLSKEELPVTENPDTITELNNPLSIEASGKTVNKKKLYKKALKRLS